MKHWTSVIAIVFVILAPETVFADRFGLCEPPECNGGGGGILGAVVGIILLGALIAIMSGAQKVIFITTWLGVVAISFALGYKGFAVFWGVVGFWISFLLTSWLSEKIEFSKSEKNGSTTQDEQDNR